MLHFEGLKETIKKGEVAKALDGIKKLEDLRLSTQASLQEVLQDTPRRLGQNADWVPFQVEKVTQDLAYLKRLAEELERKHQELEVLQFELSRLSMKRKALENLKEKKKNDFKQTESRHEQKLLDEMFHLNQRKD